MPKCAVVVSRIHIKQHPFIIVSGKVSVYDGKNVDILTAPYKGITQAGTKRILYVHEDTVWITFHPTDKNTMEEIDKNGEVTCDSFQDYEKVKGELSWHG